MKERPILFSGAMVRAILAGTKTQTRRLMASKWFRLEMCDLSTPPHLRYRTFNHRRGEGLYESGSGPFDLNDFREGYSQWHAATFCPYGQPGDRLWVKETHRNTGENLIYRADDKEAEIIPIELSSGMMPEGDNWRPSIFMPRWASRILLEIVGVRVERLQEISEADARAEGVIVQRMDAVDAMIEGREPAQIAYEDLWESINGPGSWDANPWVWVIEFKRL